MQEIMTHLKETKKCPTEDPKERDANEMTEIIQNNPL